MLSVKRIKYICLGVGISIAVEGFSQHDGCVRTHSLSGGFASRRITDDYLTTNQKDLESFDLEYSYAAISQTRYKQFTVNWNRGLNKGAGYNEFAISYSEAFSLTRNQRSGFNVYAGYALSSNPIYIKDQPETGAKHSWATTTSLSFFNLTSYAWKTNRFSMRLSLPVAGFAARPLRDEVYNENIHSVLYNSYSNVFFTSWHNLRAVKMAMEFSTMVSHHWGVLIGYKHDFKLLKKEIDFSEQANGVQVGISYFLK